MVMCDDLHHDLREEINHECPYAQEAKVFSAQCDDRFRMPDVALIDGLETAQLLADLLWYWTLGCNRS